MFELYLVNKDNQAQLKQYWNEKPSFKEFMKFFNIEIDSLYPVKIPLYGYKFSNLYNGYSVTIDNICYQIVTNKRDLWT